MTSMTFLDSSTLRSAIGSDPFHYYYIKCKGNKMILLTVLVALESIMKIHPFSKNV